MLSLKFRELFPINFTIKKYGITWRRLGRCCGLEHYKPQCTLMLRFAFTDIYYWRCPQCGKLHALKFYYHAVPYYNKTIREQNKLLEKQ